MDVSREVPFAIAICLRPVKYEAEGGANRSLYY